MAPKDLPPDPFVSARFDRLDDRTELIQAEIANVRVVLAEQHVTLKDHIRRTEALESIVAPLNTRVAMALGAIAFVGLLATVVGLLKALGLI